MATGKELRSTNEGKNSTLASVRRLLDLRRDAVLERLDDFAKGRGDKVDAVHQLRVSTRRADATLEFLLPWLPEKQTGRLREQLRKLRKATGRVRDCDVVKRMLRESPVGHPGELKQRLKRKRKSANRRLDKVASKLRCGRTHAQAWKRVISRVGGEKYVGTEEQFHPWARSQLGLWLNAIAQEMQSATESFEQLHGFRLSSKRMRYALELMPEEQCPEVAELLNFFKQVQDQLGAICDQEILRTELELAADDARAERAEERSHEQSGTSGREATLFSELQREWPSIRSQFATLVRHWND